MLNKPASPLRIKYQRLYISVNQGKMSFSHNVSKSTRKCTMLVYQKSAYIAIIYTPIHALPSTIVMRRNYDTNIHPHIVDNQKRKVFVMYSFYDMKIQHLFIFVKTNPTFNYITIFATKFIFILKSCILTINLITYYIYIYIYKALI